MDRASQAARGPSPHAPTPEARRPVAVLLLGRGRRCARWSRVHMDSGAPRPGPPRPFDALVDHVIEPTI